MANGYRHSRVQAVMKRKRKIQEELLNTLLNSKLEELSEAERDKHIVFFLDEIKSMRDEINWRVKMAYTGSLIFLSAITFTISIFFQEEGYALTQMRDNPDSDRKSVVQGKSLEP